MTNPVRTQFPVVALGGSAGALQVFFAFFRAIPQEMSPQMAFVVVLHLSPDKESYLVELLSDKTGLPVEAIVSRVEVEPGRVYVLPPDRTLDVEDGALVPKPRAPGRAHRPIDDIFQGLVREFGERTVAIVFSGTGSNGSPVLGKVREVGGCVIAQAPESAEFDEMPRRAIDSGYVDMVLEPEEMVAALERNAQRLRAKEVQAKDKAPQRPPQTDQKSKTDSKAAEDEFDRVLQSLRSESGIDFRQYKTGTLFRRIDRRVHFLGFEDWDAYAVHMEQSKDEAQILLKDVLITVTSFFRDAEAWDRLTSAVLRPLVEESSEDRPIRIWVAGCATGEEAYSVAIAIFELLRERDTDPHLDIFATDASHEVLARARMGRFPAEAVEHLPEELLDRWFDRTDQHVQIKPRVRDTMIFAPQNLIQDAPFSHADLVICTRIAGRSCARSDKVKPRSKRLTAAASCGRSHPIALPTIGSPVSS